MGSAAKVVFAFSGHGAQTWRMAQPLFDQQPVFREWMLRLDDLARQQVKRSITESLYAARHARLESFDDILLSHPAIFMVELSLAKTLLTAGVEPHAVVGASLGELCAAVIGGIVSWEEAFRFVLDQADIFERHCRSDGGMLAVLAPRERYERDSRMRTRTEIAAHGFEGHFVISGPAHELTAIEADLARENVVTQRLPVRQAFHSALMDGARDLLLKKASGLQLRPATLPVVSCMTAGQISSANPEHLWNVVRQPIRVADAIAFLERNGAHEYIDLGPGGTFATQIKYNRHRQTTSRAHALLTPFGRDLEALDAVLSHFRSIRVSSPPTGQGSVQEQAGMWGFVFPGQGSQAKGMGSDLFDRMPEFGLNEQDIDRTLGFSVRQLCLENPGGNLNITRFTQPALYVVSALHYYDAVKQGAPRFVAGHSLGEYNALLAAGVFDFLTGLRLVKKRGELMAAVSGGGMMAVLGLDSARVAEVLRAAGLDAIDVANFNAPSQVVLSGPSHVLTGATSLFEKAGANLCLPLPVSASFHSRYMAEVGRAFGEFLQSFTFSAPSIRVISNVTAKPYPTEDSSAAVKSLLVRQITSPVQWVDSVRYLIDQGVTEFREIGPGNVLTRLIAQIRQPPRR